MKYFLATLVVGKLDDEENESREQFLIEADSSIRAEALAEQAAASYFGRDADLQRDAVYVFHTHGSDMGVSIVAVTPIGPEAFDSLKHSYKVIASLKTASDAIPF